jgi:hypothetical protein
MMLQKLQITLQRNSLAFQVFASLTAFLPIYAFILFDELTQRQLMKTGFLGVQFKILMITAQVLGFAVSKGLGVKYVSEMLPENRSKSLILMLALSWFAYLLFALTPAPYNLIFIFLASLPLGMIYGTILGFWRDDAVQICSWPLTASFVWAQVLQKVLVSG